MGSPAIKGKISFTHKPTEKNCPKDLSVREEIFLYYRHEHRKNADYYFYIKSNFYLDFLLD